MLHNGTFVIVVCIYRLVMISIDLSETIQKSALKIRDKIQSETKSKNFFQQNFFSNKIFSQQKRKFVQKKKKKKILIFCL